MSESIPYGKQSINEKDIQRVVEVLRSDWISQGPLIERFEKALAGFCGARYAVAVSSGTAGLHLACLAAGLKPGDEAITTPITFLATANAVAYAGAKPVFADIDYPTVNLSATETAKKINRRTKALLPVHFAGLPADMKAFKRLAGKRLMIIEDGCHALGAEMDGSRIGACRYSDMTVFSFHPVKHITTGEGGCITTNQKSLYERLKVLRNHGIHRGEKIQRQYGPWATEMRELGFNYRLTDFQCALGLSQLDRLPEFLDRRHRIAERYNHEFKNLGDLVLLPELNPAEARHGWHLYLLRLNLGRLKCDRLRFYNALHEAGIKVQVHYRPLYHHPYYRRQGIKAAAYPAAEAYYREAVSLPIYPDLSENQQTRAIQTVKQILQKEARLASRKKIVRRREAALSA